MTFIPVIISDVATDDVASMTPENTRWVATGGGRGRLPPFTFEELKDNIISAREHAPSDLFKYVGCVHHKVAASLHQDSQTHVYGRIPIDMIALKLTIKDNRMLAKLHGMHVPSHAIQSDIVNIFKGHHCTLCDTHVSILELCKILSNADRCKKQYQKTVDANKSVLFQKKYARRNNVLEKEKWALIKKKTSD
jgi:hypothetical protein